MPESAENRDRQGQDQLRDKDLNSKVVHDALDIALLKSSKLRIHHDSSLFTCVHNAADNPLRIFQDSALKKHVLMSQSVVFFLSDE